MPSGASASRMDWSIASGSENSWYTSTRRIRSTSPSGSRASLSVPSTVLMFVTPASAASCVAMLSISG